MLLISRAGLSGLLLAVAFHVLPGTSFGDDTYITSAGGATLTNTTGLVNASPGLTWCHNIPATTCLYNAGNGNNGNGNNDTGVNTYADRCPSPTLQVVPLNFPPPTPTVLYFMCLTDPTQSGDGTLTAINTVYPQNCVIDERSLSYVHDSPDISGMLTPHSGCSSCSGGSSPSNALDGGLIPAFLTRSHRFRDMTQMSSFGPGVFCNYNVQLQIAQLDSGAWQVILFDPALSTQLILLDNGSGVFAGPTNTNFIRGLQFYTGAPVTSATTANPSAAASAVLTTFKGFTYTFGVINTHPSTLPSPWVHGDITGGTAMLHGPAAYNSDSGTYYLSAGGTDIWSTSDSYGYVYQAVTGDCTITAQVGSIFTYAGLAGNNNQGWAKAGVMIRDGLDADTKCVNCCITPGAGVNYQSRVSTGASMVWDATASESAPLWVQLNRSGDVITGSYSSDGSTWTTLYSKTVCMNTVVYVGLSLCSHNSAVLTDASFENVSLTATPVTPTSSWPAPDTAPYVYGNLAGRLTGIFDRNGYGVQVAYPTLTYDEIAASPDLQWEMSTATDSHGRVIGFTYGDTLVSGRYALSSVTMPNGSTISYSYSGGLLSGASFPDGTSSTFTYTPDATTSCTIAGIDDAGPTGTHRRANVYLTNLFYLDITEEQSYEVYNQASNLIRILDLPAAGVSGEDEVAYFSLSADFLDALHYEGQGKLKLISKSSAELTVRNYSSWSIDTSTAAVTGTLEPTYVQLTSSNDQLYRQGTPSQTIDEKNVTKTYTNDSDGYPTVITYSDSTTEQYTYNSFKEVTRYQDRLNRVTLYTYDSQGNLTQKAVGLLYTGGSDAPQAEYATYQHSYFSSGDPNQFLRATDTDANGNVTSYTYATGSESNHEIATITTPADAGAGTITAWTMTYDSYGRLKTQTDAVGRKTCLDYDCRDRRIKTKYADDSTEIEQYGSGTNANLLVGHKDRQGNLTQLGYDNAGRVTSVTAGLYTVSADGSTTTAVDSTLVETQSLEAVTLASYLPGTSTLSTRSINGNLKTFAYDYRQRLASQTVYPTSSGGLTSNWIYIDNLLAQTTDAYGRNTYMIYRASDALLTRKVQGLIPSDTVGSASAAASVARSSATSNPPYLVTDYGLDYEGQQTSITDPRGIVNTATFDSRGRLTDQVEDTASLYPLNAHTHFNYDAQSNQTEIQTPRYFVSTDSGGYNKAHITMTYTQRNLLATKDSATGDSGVEGDQSFVYYDDGRLDTRSDENSHIWTTTWGACCARVQGHLDPSVTLPGAGSSTNPAQIIRHNDYGDTTLEAVVSDYTTVTFPTLSSTTNLTVLTSSTTVNEATTAYDVRHRPIARTVWLSPITSVWGNTPPIAGWGSYSSSAGLTTFYRYDDNLTDSLGLSNSTDPYSVYPYLTGLGFGTNANGSAMVVINPAGEPTWTIYDGMGRVVRIVDGNGNATTTTYDVVDGSGLVDTAVTDALSHTVTTSADAMGRVQIITDQLSNHTTQGFDANGNIVVVRDPNSVGRNDSFDNRNRRTNSTDTVSAVKSWSYDADNNVVSAVDALYHTTLFAFDARERKVSSTDRLSGVTSFTYDPVSNLLTMTDADTNACITTGGITTYGYDPRNLLLTELFPPGQATPGSPTTAPYDERTYAYDAAHRLVSRVDQNDVTTGYSYDLANRLTTRAYPSASDTFAYDAASRLITATSGLYPTVATLSYTDGGEKAGRLTSETQTVSGVTNTITYAYDEANRQTQETYPDGIPVNRTFTNRNQLESVGRTVGNWSNIVSSLGYDAGMRRTNMALGNSLTEYRTYNLDNTVATIAESGATNYSYSYDANKNVTAETAGTLTAESVGYGYDYENRVTSWNRNTTTETQDWTLSLVGDWQATAKTGPNAFSQTRCHTAVHETKTIIPTGLSALALVYDQNGNLTSDGSNSQSYTWDPENRLTQTQASGVTVGSYVYDALGRRLAKTVDNTQTTFVNDGAQTISEYTTPVFHQADIGTVGTPGTFSESGGVVTMTASGDDIWSTADNFNYAYRQLTGDGSITALLISETATSSYTKAGVMIRDSLDPGAAEACMEYQYSESYPVFQYRDSDGGGTAQTSASSTWPTPIWLRLVRSGITFYAYCSSDGVTWVSAGSQNISMGSTVYIGLALCAHDATADTTGVFENITTTGNITSVDSPTLSNEYVYGSYIDEPIALINSGGTFFYADNRVYSPAALTDVWGAVVERYRYDSYGNRTIFESDDSTVRASSLYGNQRGFTGYYLDNESGLYYARERMYSSTLGRFIERDPWRLNTSTATTGDGYRDGISLYCAYFVPGKDDPSGMETCYGNLPIKGGVCCNCILLYYRNPERCCNGVVYNPANQCCTSTGLENKTVSRWVCSRPLDYPFFRNFQFGPLSHSYYYCENPAGQSPLPPAYGKQPRKPGLPGSNFWGPGYIALDPPELDQPNLNTCEEIKFCPSEAPPCEEGPTGGVYFMFTPWTNCHAAARRGCGL